MELDMRSRRYSRRSVRFAGSVALLAGLQSLAEAQDDETEPPPPAATAPAPAAGPDPAPDPDATVLPGYDIIVTASRRDEPAFQSPRAVSVVDRLDIDEQVSRTTPEALLEEPGIFLQRTNHGGGAPIIRGHLGNRILLLVDGIRLNNSTFRQGPNQYLNTVDPIVVDRIEIVRGPGSALFGSDAIGGLINVLTERPRLGAGGAYGAARLASASMDQSAQLGLRVGWSTPRTGALASASFRHFGDLRGGGGYDQRFTGYDQWTGSVEHELRPGHRLSFTVQHDQQSDVPRTDRSSPLDFRMFSLQQRQLVYGRYTATGIGPFVQLSGTASYGRQREVETRYRVGRDQREEDDLTTGTIGLQTSGELYLAGPLVVGAELYADDMSVAAASGPLTGGMENDPAGRRYPAGIGYLTASAFAHHEVTLTPRWKLVSELRVGAIRIRVPEDDRLVLLFPEEDLPVLPRIRDVVPVYAGGLHARWEATPWAALSAGAMLGFRAPNIDDYARLGVEGPGFAVPGRAIDPERALSGEVGVKLAPGRATASAYYAYTVIDDAISRRVTTLPGSSIPTVDGLRILQPANADSARYHSIELTASAPVWRDLSAFGGFAWTRGEQSTTDPVAMTTTTEPTSKTPPAFGTLGLGWRAPGGAWFGEGMLRYAFDQTRMSELDLGDTRICPDAPGDCAGTPGWAVFALRGGLRINSHMRATVLIENLADAEYRYHASGIQGSGLGVSGLVEGEL
jgi:outer membrane receptor protein involved in Fe transport